MSILRRIIASYGRCRRYAPDFCVAVFTVAHRTKPIWTASAILRNGKTFLRALDVAVDGDGAWRADQRGTRVAVPDITLFFADWLESVEDELGAIAYRGLASDIASPFFHYTPKDKDVS